MSAIYVMIVASLFIAVSFLGAFIWSVRRGHYDDDYTPSIRILLDDPIAVKSQKNETKVNH